MLSNAEGVANHRRAMLGQHMSHALDILGGNTNNRCHLLWSIVTHGVSQCREVFTVLFYELVVVQVIANQHMHQGVEQSDVGAPFELQMFIGKLHQFVATRIDHHQFCPLADRIFQERGSDRMGFSHIGTNH